MSAGNYGKAFAYATNESGLKAVVLMPDTAPPNRAEVIQVIQPFKQIPQSI
jgi:threonine dehydratase